MKKMVCTLKQESDYPSSFFATPDTTNLSDKARRHASCIATEFEKEVNAIYGKIMDHLVVDIGPDLDERIVPDESDIEANREYERNEALFVAMFPLPIRLWWNFREKMYKKAYDWFTPEEEKTRDRYSFRYRNTAQYAYVSLLDILIDEALKSEENKSELPAEDWSALCLQGLKPEDFRQHTGEKPEYMPYIIGRAAISLVQAPLFDKAQLQSTRQSPHQPLTLQVVNF